MLMTLRTVIFSLLCLTIEPLLLSVVLADDQSENLVKTSRDDTVTLDTLFAELEKATSLAEAQRVERIIWAKWHWHQIPRLSQKLKLGTTYLQENNFKKALYIFNKIIKEAPAFSEAYNKRATTYFLMKKYDKSLMDIKVTLTLEPRHFGALSGMGLIFMNRGDFQRALMAFTAVLKIYPFSISAAANMKIIERELNLKVL
jgi:tetratricopeptide (TPR) repeat protein